MYIAQRLSFFLIALTLFPCITHASEKRSESFAEYENRIKQDITQKNAQEKYDNALGLLMQGFNLTVSDGNSAKKCRQRVLKGLVVRQGALEKGALTPTIAGTLNYYDRGLLAHYMLKPADENTHAKKAKTDNVDACLQYQLISPDDRLYSSDNPRRWHLFSLLWVNPEIAPFVPLFVKHGSKASQSNSDGVPMLCFFLSYHAEYKTKTVEAFLQDMYTAYTSKEAFLDDASTIPAETFSTYIRRDHFSETELKRVDHFIAECNHHRTKQSKK